MSAPPLRVDELAVLGFDHALGVVDGASSSDVVTPRQVHGRTVATAHAGERAEADALVTETPGLAVGVVTADCVPILLVDLERRAVVAVHAGWRGTGLDIAGEAVRALGRLGVPPGDLLAVVGPHIGSCCYEVDAPVRVAIDCDAAFTPGREGHFQLDLELANRLALEAAGVRPSRIVSVGDCSCCGLPERPSHRRAPGEGRMLHWVRLDR